MLCDFQTTPTEAGFLQECAACGHSEVTVTENFYRECGTDNTASAGNFGAGPGTEITAMFKALGAEPKPGCLCAVRADQMDRLGIDGCREHRAEVLGWLREAYDVTGWAERFKAARLALTTGLAFKIDWRDPLSSLLDEAIRRAEAAERDRAGEAAD